MCDNWKEMFEKYSKVDFDTKIRDWARYIIMIQEMQ